MITSAAARDAGKAKPARRLAGIHDAGRKRRLLDMLHHQHVEILGIGERAAEEIGIGDRLVAVGHGDGAGLLEEADLGHQLARQGPW